MAGAFIASAVLGVNVICVILAAAAIGVMKELLFHPKERKETMQ